jgi:hypothetical protein
MHVAASPEWRVMTLRATCLAITLAAQATVPGVQPASVAPQPSSVAADNNRHVREWLSRLGGRQDRAARDVFKNVQLEWLEDVPASQFLDVMNGGYASALGVRCVHCHVEGDFASDEKRAKRAAREMARLHWDINRRLAAMEHLKGSAEERFVNCATCHRGRVDPRDP